MTETKQLIDTITLGIEETLANMHTCTIAKVTRVNTKTINCKPVMNRLVDGQSIELPEFAEVPVVVLQGGGSYLHFPITVNDYVLLLFTERCFDGWYNGQDFQIPLEYRMHDYSDGVAICGLNNAAGLFTIPSVIQRTGDINQDGDITHQGDREQTGLFTLNGDFIINGSGGGGTATANNVTINVIIGDVIADGISLKNHTHSGVTAGSSSTGGPQ